MVLFSLIIYVRYTGRGSGKVSGYEEECLGTISHSVSLSIQFLFDSWLVEKEELVRSIQSSDFKDQNEMVASLKKLAVSDMGFEGLIDSVRVCSD